MISVWNHSHVFSTQVCAYSRLVNETQWDRKGKEEVQVRAGEKWKIQYNKDWKARFNFCCFDFNKKSKLGYRSLTSLPVCLLFSYSVERAPHVGKEREGGRASDGAEGTTQRGGDLHRWLNSAPPNPHTHSHTHADSVKGHLHAKVNTTIPEHIHAHMHMQFDEWTDYPQYHGSTFTTPRVSATRNSAELTLAFGYFLPNTYVRIYTHKHFISFSLITICPKSASHFRTIHMLAFIRSPVISTQTWSCMYVE